jgi:nucleotide-binding universal stress UspA family protein
MATRVLVPLDGSELSMRALDHALDRWADAELVALHVIDPLDVVYGSEAGGPANGEAWREAATAAAEDLFDRARREATAAGADLETELVVGSPGRAIVEYVTDHDVDHVVMGSHGRSGLSRLILGSVAERVLRRAPATVTVVR